MSTERKRKHSDGGIILGIVALGLIVAAFLLNDTAPAGSSHPENYGFAWKYLGVPGLVLGVLAVLLEISHRRR